MNSIGWALKALHSGNKVRRAGWNGKGMWLVFVPPQADVQIKPDSPYGQAGLTSVYIDAHIDMFTAKGTMQPGWLPSQADLHAMDWELA